MVVVLPRRTVTALVLVIALAWCGTGCSHRRTPERAPRSASSTAVSESTRVGTRTPTPAETSKPPALRIVVPGYVSPGEIPYWDAVIHGAPTVEEVILNPDNGPGDAAQSAYQDLVAKLRSAGIGVLGYVRTGYGARNSSAVISDIDHWRQWYGITDIFLDEVPTEQANVSAYASYAAIVHGVGGRVVINPGTVPARQYFAFADAVVTFEDSAGGYVQPGATPAWLQDEPSNKVWNIVIGAPQARLGDVIRAAHAHHAGVIFVTDAAGPDPYDGLPTYWSREIATIADDYRTALRNPMRGK